MPEVAVQSLSPRLQRLVDNARSALQQGNFEYAADVGGEILKEAPGCLPIRRLQREALLQQFRHRRGRIGRMLNSITGAGLLLSGIKDPAAQLAAADKILSSDPTSISGLKLLAAAAGAGDLPQTAVFAWECLRELQPTDGATLLGLSTAYLAAERPKEALAAAEQVLRRSPQDAEALALIRRAAVMDTMRAGNWETTGSFREKLRASEFAPVDDETDEEGMVPKPD